MRAALAKSTEMIDLLLAHYVDRRSISSFSGKRASHMIDYPPLMEYNDKFEKILENPFFNFRYRVADYFRTGLAKMKHPNPNFIKEMQLSSRELAER
jgi:hypothetical protein